MLHTILHFCNASKYSELVRMYFLRHEYSASALVGHTPIGISDKWPDWVEIRYFPSAKRPRALRLLADSGVIE